MLKLFVCSILLLVAVVQNSVALQEDSDIPSSIPVVSTSLNEEEPKSLSTGEDVLVEKNVHYIYNPDVYGWLKLHRIPATFEEALLKCYNEGAILASPLDQQLLNALGLIIMNSNMNNSVVLGTQALLYGDFFAIEGVRLEDMPVKWNMDGGQVTLEKCLILAANGTVYTVDCSRRFPYICYKKRDSKTVMNKCGTFDDEYHFDNSTGSCYKVHLEHQSWYRAHMICEDEGGYLIIINNEEEAKRITYLMPREHFYSSSHSLSIGIRALNEGRHWITIHGDRIENVYNKWGNSNNGYNEQDQSCGYFDTSSRINAISCDHKAMYMCEKDPETKRFGPTID